MKRVICLAACAAMILAPLAPAATDAILNESPKSPVHGAAALRHGSGVLDRTGNLGAPAVVPNRWPSQGQGHRPGPGRHPGQGGWQQPGQGGWQQPGQGGRDPQLDQWVIQELLTVDQLMVRQMFLQAHQRLGSVRYNLASRPEWEYRQAASEVQQIENLIQHAQYPAAHQQVRQLRLRFQQGGGGGGGGQVPPYQIVQELSQALRYLEYNQPQPSRPHLGRAYTYLARSLDPRLRQEAEQVRYADQLAARFQAPQAAQIVRMVIARIGGGGGGGGGNPHDPDYANRQEWRRDIRDLIDTIQGGNLNMAQNDLQRLCRDIRQDGYDWNRNRVYVQRLQYVGQNLHHGNQGWCIQQLREISRDLNF